MRRPALYSSKGELASRNWKARVTLGGTRENIGTFIPCQPQSSFQALQSRKKESRKIDSLAACRRLSFHGLRGNIRARSDLSLAMDTAGEGFWFCCSCCCCGALPTAFIDPENSPGAEPRTEGGYYAWSGARLAHFLWGFSGKAWLSRLAARHLFLCDLSPRCCV